MMTQIVPENFNEDGDCIHCHGTGYHLKAGDITTTCPYCGGTGDDRIINPTAQLPMQYKQVRTERFVYYIPFVPNPYFED